jgi:hypothetical protein
MLAGACCAHASKPAAAAAHAPAVGWNNGGLQPLRDPRKEGHHYAQRHAASSTPQEGLTATLTDGRLRYQLLAAAVAAVGNRMWRLFGDFWLLGGQAASSLAVLYIGPVVQRTGGWLTVARECHSPCM